MSTLICHQPPATCHLPPATFHLPPDSQHLSPVARHSLGPIHLVGHSLGAHSVGKIGRTFKSATGNLVERITGGFFFFLFAYKCLVETLNSYFTSLETVINVTSAADKFSGLDPAGPRFVDGWFHSALPELKDNILT